MLKNVQNIFWQLITAPEGVEQGLKENPQIDIKEWFAGDKLMPPTRRLNIYANMYFWRIHDALKEDFPAVAYVIGDTHWHNLIVDYLLVHPSSTPLLQHVGIHLPQFLQTVSLQKHWPFLADLALLEWERCQLFEAKDATYLTKQDLQKIPAEKWPTLQLQLVPAFRLLELDWNVLPLWNKADETLEPTSTSANAALIVEQQKTFLRLWRKDYQIYHQAIDLEEWGTLQALQAGKTFSDFCEQVQSAEKAAQMLANWVEAGIINGCTKQQNCLL